MLENLKLGLISLFKIVSARSVTVQTGSLAVHNPLTLWDSRDAARQPSPIPLPAPGQGKLHCLADVLSPQPFAPSQSAATLVHPHVMVSLGWGLTHEPPELNPSPVNLSCVISISHGSTLTKVPPFNFKQFLTALAQEGIWQHLLTSPEMLQLQKRHFSVQNYLGFFPTHSFLIVICLMFLS